MSLDIVGLSVAVIGSAVYVGGRLALLQSLSNAVDRLTDKLEDHDARLKVIEGGVNATQD